MEVDLSKLKEILGDLLKEQEDPSWSLTIIRVDNGYRIYGSNGEMVLEDSEKDNLLSHEHLLWEVMEYFNFGGSKHDPERLRVVREKQNV